MGLWLRGVVSCVGGFGWGVGIGVGGGVGGDCGWGG